MTTSRHLVRGALALLAVALVAGACGGGASPSAGKPKLTFVAQIDNPSQGFSWKMYQKNADWKRDPNGRINVESLKKLATFMHEKLQWLEKPVNVDAMVDQGYLPR